MNEPASGPKYNSGAVCDSPDDTWQRINSALYHGCRGLRGGSTLIRLLAKYRGVKNRQAQPSSDRQNKSSLGQTSTTSAPSDGR